MQDEKFYKGFQTNFLQTEVSLPVLNEKNQKDLAPVNDNAAGVLNFLNYSVQLSKSRRFPFFTASNINGKLFKKAERAPTWKIDQRAKNFQWGQSLYSAEHSDFDKGHMTKREDVQWGRTPAIAQKGADSTFFYANAVPQHKRLNQRIWKSLEDYVLHAQTRKNGLKVCVFTGPVLSQNDPPFVTKVEGQQVLIPILFWKVIVFPKSDGQLYRAGFMMSQNNLLTKNEIIRSEEEAATEEDLLFMTFDDAATYQVNIPLIEKLTGLKFIEGLDSYKDDRSIKLILKEIDIADPDLESDKIEDIMGYEIENLIL